jgi:hypothetical protein
MRRDKSVEDIVLSGMLRRAELRRVKIVCFARRLGHGLSTRSVAME